MEYFVARVLFRRNSDYHDIGFFWLVYYWGLVFVELAICALWYFFHKVIGWRSLKILVGRVNLFVIFLIYQQT